MSDKGEKYVGGYYRRITIRLYKEKIRDRTIKNMDKYVQIKNLHHDLQTQVYTYAFMLVYP